MKGIVNMSCASENSTSIITSNMEFLSFTSPSSSTTSFTPGGRAIDRYNPIITDDKRRGSINASTPTTPCSNAHPIEPALTNKLNKPLNKSSRRKKSDSQRSDKKILKEDAYTVAPVGADDISQPESSRYLLDESSSNLFTDVDIDTVLKSPPKKVVDDYITGPKLDAPVKDPDYTLPGCSNSGSSDQVVILRVSLHCRGCEKKMRKHLSKMPGIRSFTIEFAAKKVTVIGDVTPLEVISSISKVKNAQLWTPTIM